MPVLTLVFENDPVEIGKVVEKGLSSGGYTLQADARIKTADNPTGVGPVSYIGKHKKADGTVSTTEGEPRDLVCMFFEANNCKRAEFFMVNPIDVTDTAADFLANHGGDITAMLALAPTVA